MIKTNATRSEAFTAASQPPPSIALNHRRGSIYHLSVRKSILSASIE